MKLEITQKGAHTKDGKADKELEVGEIIEVKGDTIPKHLVGKCREVPSGKAKPRKAVTNPAKGAVKQDANKAPEGGEQGKGGDS